MEINIAICDDNKNYVDEVIDYLESCPWKRNNKFIYHTFYSGESLVEYKQNFDFIILDIEMDKISGVDVKDIFYEINNNSRIIFLTNYDEYMPESFGKNVYGYINKDLICKMDIPLNKIFKEILEHRIFEIGDDMIDLYEVYYVSADGPYINIHYEHDYQIYRMTLKEFVERVENTNFIRVHRSYFVNMRYVKNFDDKTVILDNGAKLDISKGNRKLVKKVYSRYLMESVMYG